MKDRLKTTFYVILMFLSIIVTMAFVPMLIAAGTVIGAGILFVAGLWLFGFIVRSALK